MLITTIVMMLVLAVALTTSSLAWFSAAQASVTASGGQFTASAAKTNNVNIAISKTLDNYGKEVAMDQYTDLLPLNPIAPIGETDNTITFCTAETLGAFIEPGSIKKYEEFNLNASQGNEDTNTSDPLNGKPYYDTIFLVNYDDTNPLKGMKLTFNAKIQGRTEGAGVAVPVAAVRVARSSNGTDWTEVKTVVIVFDTVSNRYLAYDLFEKLKDLPQSDSKLKTSVVSRTNTAMDAEIGGVPYSGVGNIVVQAGSEGWTHTAVATFDFDTENAGTGLAAKGDEIARIDICMWYDGSSLTTNSHSTTTTFDLKIEGVNTIS